MEYEMKPFAPPVIPELDVSNLKPLIVSQVVV